MIWSLNKAHNETGVAKATILRALESGRLSGTKNELGVYDIDSSEFFRVFPPKAAETPPVPGTRNETDPPETSNETGWLDAELKRLSELLRMTDLERAREREKAEDEIRFLRRRLELADDEREELAKERRTLTAQLLTYQRPPEPPSTPPTPAAGPTTGQDAGNGNMTALTSKRGLWSLFRRTG